MGYIDIHSHVIPGADDGARTKEQSLRMLSIAAQNGIDRMILTPHNKAGHRNISPAGIRKSVEQLQFLVDAERIPIKLYPGCEIFFREGVGEMLEENQLCSLADGPYVLVEFMPAVEFSYIRSAVYELGGSGFIPIIAHVERYECLIKDISNAGYLLDRGAYLQMNAGCLEGGLSELRMKKAVKRMLKEQMIHFVATDAQNDTSRAPRMAECAAYLRKKCGHEYAARLLWKNAWAVLDGEQL